jgi:hypothetical protein
MTLLDPTIHKKGRIWQNQIPPFKETHS